MQSAVNSLRNSLWTNLKQIYDQFPTNVKGQMDSNTVQQFIKNIVGQNTKSQIDYVMRNMFRIDIDKNGCVSFDQLARFLFRYHCAQISLQRMHSQGKMSKGNQLKMNMNEFQVLCNNSWSFLNIRIPNGTVRQIFNYAYKDQNGYITYSQYFRIIQKYICEKIQIEPIEPDPSRNPVDPQNSKKPILISWIWNELYKLFQTFSNNKSLQNNQKILIQLIYYFLGTTDVQDIEFVINRMWRIWTFRQNIINFHYFVTHFLYVLAELGLSKFAKYHRFDKKQINKQQFIVLFRNTFYFLQIGRVKFDFLTKIFDKLDYNDDGLITYDRYLDWIKKYIALMEQADQNQYWINDQNIFNVLYPQQRDSSKITNTSKLISNSNLISTSKISSTSKINSTSYLPSNLSSIIKVYVKQKFVFPNYNFSKQVRQKMASILSKYDINKSNYFGKQQVTNALKQILHQNQLEIYYMVKNSFRFQKNLDGKVNLTQLTDFCVQQHFGQMALQRLHKEKQNYQKSITRQMNKQQFGKTLKYALQPINIQISQNTIDELWSVIDLKRSGWVTYKTYFEFLSQYFKGQHDNILPNPYPIPQPKPQEIDPQEIEWETWFRSLKGLPFLQYFIRLITDQLRKQFMKYDENKNLMFQDYEIRNILKKYIRLEQHQINQIIQKYFLYQTKSIKLPTFEQLSAIILDTYFIQIIMIRIYHCHPKQYFNVNQFIQLIINGCRFLRYQPDITLLTSIFGFINSNKNNFITFSQYLQFFRKYLGKGTLPPPPKPIPDNKDNNSNKPSYQQQNFINLLWGQLKKYFDKYDVGSKGYLVQQEFKRFVIQVLNQKSQKQLNYIFWNMFRVDVDNNKKIEFEQFAPFILNHAGQIALQRFHSVQIKGKNTLTVDQLHIILNKGYGFLINMPKDMDAIIAIYKRIGKGGNVSYGNYLTWIIINLSKRKR